MNLECEEKMDEKKNEQKNRFYVGEIATQTAPVIVDGTNNTQYDVASALAEVLNRLEKLMKLIE